MLSAVIIMRSLKIMFIKLCMGYASQFGEPSGESRSKSVTRWFSGWGFGQCVVVVLGDDPDFFDLTCVDEIIYPFKNLQLLQLEKNQTKSSKLEPLFKR